MATRFLSDLAGTLLSAFRIASATLNSAALTAARTFTLPNQGGVLARVGDPEGWDVVLRLASGNTIAGMSAGAVINAIISGYTRDSAGAILNKVLFQGALPTPSGGAGTVLYTSTSIESVVTLITLDNSTSNDVAATSLFVNGTDIGHRFGGTVTVPGNGSATWTPEGWKISNSIGTSP